MFQEFAINFQRISDDSDADAFKLLFHGSQDETFVWTGNFYNVQIAKDRIEHE